MADANQRDTPIVRLMLCIPDELELHDVG